MARRNVRTGGAAALFLILTAHFAYGQEGGIRSEIPGGSDDTAAVHLSIGPGLVLYTGNTGWALNFGGLVPSSRGSRLFFGADLGLNFWNFQTISGTPPTDQSATGLQLLPTVVYRFDVGEGSAVAPYLGLSAGPYLYMESVSTAGVEGEGTTSLFFEVLLRPGFFAQIAGSVVLGTEAKLGLLDGEFIFLPQANLVVSI